MFTRTSLIAMAVVLSSGTLAMADAPAANAIPPAPSKYTDGGPKPLDTSIKPNEVKRLSRYISGREVFNEKGDQIGTVQDIVLDGPTCGLSYAVLSYSGSDKLFAVPWHAFHRKVDDTEKLYLYQSTDVLKNAPGFPKDQWPNTADPAFRSQVDPYYDSIAKDKDRAVKDKELSTKTGPVKDGLVWSRRSSAIIDAKVINKQDEEIGVIKDIVFNPRTGVVHYAVLSYGGFLGKGDKLFAVPISALDSKVDQKVFVLDVTKDYLANAPGFDKEAWPRWDDEEMRVRLDEYYRVSNRKAPVAK